MLENRTKTFPRERLSKDYPSAEFLSKTFQFCLEVKILSRKWPHSTEVKKYLVEKQAYFFAGRSAASVVELSETGRMRPSVRSSKNPTSLAEILASSSLLGSSTCSGFRFSGQLQSFSPKPSDSSAISSPFAGVSAGLAAVPPAHLQSFSQNSANSPAVSPLFGASGGLAAGPPAQFQSFSQNSADSPAVSPLFGASRGLIAGPPAQSQSFLQKSAKSLALASRLREAAGFTAVPSCQLLSFTRKAANSPPNASLFGASAVPRRKECVMTHETSSHLTIESIEASGSSDTGAQLDSFSGLIVF